MSAQAEAARMILERVAKAAKAGRLRRLESFKPKPSPEQKQEAPAADDPAEAAVLEMYADLK